ncbi:MAG: glycosyltransferase [Alphaproteobacteria bacterium]|nr:glycosyltransferase [Alphaproteobacteria bacterium]
MPKVSVIIPVYNVEKYLPACLDSILNQTLKDIEIICVNDGSPDNSHKILDAYAMRYPHIRVINQENAGLSAARNTGINAACPVSGF